MVSVEGVLEFCRWDVTAVLVEPAMIEPVDPFGSGKLDLLQGPPGPAGFDELGLEQPIDRLRERVVPRRQVRPIRLVPSEPCG